MCFSPVQLVFFNKSDGYFLFKTGGVKVLLMVRVQKNINKCH